MRLAELEAKFYHSDDGRLSRPVETLSDANCVQFLCDKCFKANGGPIGTHMVRCWFNLPGVDPSWVPGPGRWNPSGTGIDDLTFVGPGLTSVWIKSGCGAHFHVVNGEVTA